MNARSVVRAAGETIKQETAGFRENGAEIAKFGFRDRVPDESEVTVEVSGAAAIAIKVAGTDGYFAMPESLEILVGWMRDSAIPEFAPVHPVRLSARGEPAGTAPSVRPCAARRRPCR
jgi:hypothetical protein